MKTGAAARRYAKALHAIAIENNLLDKMEEELLFLAAILNQEKDFREVFSHPHILESEKKELIKTLLEDKLSPYIINFTYFLIDKRREKELAGIVDEYVKLANKTRNIVLAEVITAIPITDEQISKVKAKLEKMTGKDVRIAAKVEPAIIGGMLIRLGDKVMDGSIKRHLERMQAGLHEIQVREIGVSN